MRCGREQKRDRCTIAHVSNGPQLIRPPAAEERNWVPLVVAAVIVLGAAVALVLFYEHGKNTPARLLRPAQ